jgi:hypothetical protein
MPMRKILTLSILVVFALFSGINIKAQGFKYGIEAGFDFANIQFKGFNEKDYILMPSYNFNLFAGYQFNKLIGFTIEPGFMQKGGLVKSWNGNFRVQKNYIQFPLLVDFYITKRLYLSTGPEFAFLMSAQIWSSNWSGSIYDQHDTKFEFSGLIGINYNIYKSFDIAFRYNHGISNFKRIYMDAHDGSYMGESREYNQYFQLLVRYKIKS